MKVHISYENKNFEATIEEVDSLTSSVLSQVAGRAIEELSLLYAEEVSQHTVARLQNIDRYSKLASEMSEKSAQLLKLAQEAKEGESESETKIELLATEIRTMIGQVSIVQQDISEATSQLESASRALKEFTEVSKTALELIPFQSKTYSSGTYTLDVTSGKRIVMKLT